MRKPLVLLAATIGLAILATGCAGPEKKFSRGMANVTEFARLGEWRRSVEQAAIWSYPSPNYSYGLVSGFNKSLARTGLGIYEIVTFPIPSYGPIFTNYLSPSPVYPDSYHPRLVAGPEFDTDTALGFSGGDFAPIVPGSRFHVQSQPH